MKIFVVLLLNFFLIYAPGSHAQEFYSPGNIEKIVISSGILLEIERSEESALEITSPDLDTDCIINTTEDGVLTLKLVSSINCSGKVTARLRCPSIKELEIMGNAEVSTFNVIKTDTLKITQRSGGKSFLDLDVDYFEVLLTEGSILSASGYATTQVINVNTSATFSAFELEGEDVEIQASFGGKGKVCAARKLKALSKMGGYISYTCDPSSVEIEKKGNGVVEKLAN